MKVKTPVGEISWKGNLTLETELNLPNGDKRNLMTYVTLTNGSALDWLEDYIVE